MTTIQKIHKSWMAQIANKPKREGVLTFGIKICGTDEEQDTPSDVIQEMFAIYGGIEVLNGINYVDMNQFIALQNERSKYSAAGQGQNRSTPRRH